MPTMADRFIHKLANTVEATMKEMAFMQMICARVRESYLVDDRPSEDYVTVRITRGVWLALKQVNCDPLCPGRSDLGNLP